MLTASMPKYPLEPLAAVRETAVKSATADLAGAIRRREDASSARHTAEAKRDAHARAAAKVREGELAALGNGRLRAADLARADAWGVRVSAERAALGSAVERAATAETGARQEEASAQVRLGERHADARVVDVHRERWEAEQRRALEAREEEASAEAWRPKR
jgi:hypothetical protein